MTQRDTAEFFNKDNAQHYDKRWEKLSPINDCLYLISQFVLRDLPPAAKVLCVGVGTGREMFYLANAFPQWQFTAVDTSSAMLDVCRQKAEALGITSRVHFYEGSIQEFSSQQWSTQSSPAEKNYDAATSFLVSQFLTDMHERESFFETIRHLLKPQGILINCDLAQPAEILQQNVLHSLWTNMHLHTGASLEQAKSSTSLWQQHVAVSEPVEIHEILTAAGFDNVTKIYQALFIHAWVAFNKI